MKTNVRTRERNLTLRSEPFSVNNGSFLRSYFDAFNSIEGWFSPDAAILLMAYNQLIQDQVVGDVLEIGVFNGLSAIGLAALRGKGRRFYAADIFSYGDSSPTSMKEKFLENMAHFHKDLDFLEVLEGPSRDLRPEVLGEEFSFCHVDGDHSARATYSDAKLCAEILLPGGLLAVDDFFNWTQPGVSEGMIEFMLDYPGTLLPVAIGFNKVLYQKIPPPFDINERFREVFPDIPPAYGEMMGNRVFMFTAGVAKAVDLQASQPGRLVPLPPAPWALSIEALRTNVTAPALGRFALPIRITNLSVRPLPSGESSPFRVSYHLFAEDGRLLQFDNERTYLRRTMLPGETHDLDLAITNPAVPGRYLAQLDLVWEGVEWLSKNDVNLPFVELTAQ